MLREHDRQLRILLLVSDVSLCGLAFVGTLLWRPEVASLSWGLVALGVASASALPAAIRALEDQPSTRLKSLSAAVMTLVLAGSIVAVGLAGLAFLLAVPIEPVVLSQSVLLQLSAVGLVRMSILAGLRALRRRGRNYRGVVVIGSGPLARQLTDLMAQHPEWGLKVVGYVDDSTPIDPAIPKERVHKFADLPALIRNEVVHEVFAACPRSMLVTLGPVISLCSDVGLPVSVMTDLFGDYVPQPRMRELGNRSALTFAPVHHSQSQLKVKRLLDIAGALVGLVLSAPLIAVAGTMIRITSPGPILFKQVRCGLYGRSFTMFKLRTMVENAEDQQDEIRHMNEMEGPVFKIERDPRITAVGRFLRAFSIDELPQFWNVLVGDMSLVGPRPPVPSEVAEYEHMERRRLSMRPGLTCLWQVRGRNQIGFDEWVKLDLEYIDSWSLSQDIKILAQTLPTIAAGNGS